MTHGINQVIGDAGRHQQATALHRDHIEEEVVPRNLRHLAVVLSKALTGNVACHLDPILLRASHLHIHIDPEQEDIAELK